MLSKERNIFKARALFPNCLNELYRNDDQLILCVDLAGHSDDPDDNDQVYFSIHSLADLHFIDPDGHPNLINLDQLKTWINNQKGHYNI